MVVDELIRGGVRDVVLCPGSRNAPLAFALADADLRAAFAEKFPEAWRRIERRRAFMIETLGIRLRPEVLPFSNIPAYLSPFLLSPTRAMACR